MNQTVGGRFVDFLSDPVMVQLVENEVDRLEQFDLGPTLGSSPACARVRADARPAPVRPRTDRSVY